MDGLSREDATRWTRIGVLAAFALVLGYLETFIPIPIPGVKLGLANIAILLCFMRLDAGAALFVTLLKVLAQGLLFGSPLTFAYSLAGSLAAFAVMALIVRVPGMHPVMVSICGAVAHTAGQMVVAAALLGTRFVWIAAPVLMVAALATGALCGVLAVRLDRAIDAADAPSGELPAITLSDLPSEGGASVGPRLLGFAVFAIIAMLQSDVVMLAALAALAVAACIYARVEPAAIWRGLRAFLVLFVLSAVAVCLGNAQGDAIAQLGPLTLTDAAARTIAAMGLRLFSVMGASVAVMALTPQDDLLAFTVRTARHLSARGVNTQGPLLALNVCLQTVPVLASGIAPSDPRLLGRSLVDAIAGIYLQAERIAEAICSVGEGAADAHA